MSANSTIEWTDATWNPVRGCDIVSPGCTNCYAMKVAHRFSGPGKPYEGLTKLTKGGPVWTGAIMLVDNVKQPLSWKKPRRIFVNSMSDLFHEKVPFTFIKEVWDVISEAHWHTFQILTKRPERLLAFHRWLAGPDDLSITEWPRNAWIGVSVEDQRRADERIPLLLRAPAAVRWLSVEPLLGPVSFRWASWVDSKEMHRRYGCHGHLDGLRGISWVVAGGESGHGARPMHPAWVRAIRDQCHEAEVPFFFKQWGAWAPGHVFPDYIPSGESCDFGERLDDNERVWHVGKKLAGRTLDGRLHDGYPA